MALYNYKLYTTKGPREVASIVKKGSSRRRMKESRDKKILQNYCFVTSKE